MDNACGFGFYLIDAGDIWIELTIASGVWGLNMLSKILLDSVMFTMFEILL